MQYSSDQYPATNKPGDFSPLGGGLLQQGVFVQAGTQQLPLASSHLQQPLQSMQYVQQTPVQPFVGQSNTQQPYSQHPAAQQYCNQPPASMQYGTQQMPTQYPGVQQPQYQDTWNQQSPGYQQAYMQQTMPMQNSPGLQPGYTPTQSSTPGTAVLGNQYCAQQEQIFFVNEKWASLSRDDFTILDQTRQPVFKLDSSAISLKQKRVLKTIKGQAVCSLKKKLLSGNRPTWFVSLGAAAKDAERVAVIKKDVYQNSHSASLYLNGNTSQFFAQPVPDYSARGDLQNRSFFIYRGNMPVAEIMRSTSTTEKVTGANHYVLRVSAGTDCALMITFCVVIDELFND